LHRPMDEAVERLAAGVVQNQDRVPVLIDERARMDGPGRIQLRRERVFVLQLLDGSAGAAPRDRRQQEDGRFVWPRGMPATGQSEIAIVAERLADVGGKVGHRRPVWLIEWLVARATPMPYGTIALNV